jgi:hypothetical protein
MVPTTGHGAEHPTQQHSFLKTPFGAHAATETKPRRWSMHASYQHAHERHRNTTANMLLLVGHSQGRPAAASVTDTQQPYQAQLPAAQLELTALSCTGAAVSPLNGCDRRAQTALLQLARTRRLLAANRQNPWLAGSRQPPQCSTDCLTTPHLPASTSSHPASTTRPAQESKRAAAAF